MVEQNDNTQKWQYDYPMGSGTATIVPLRLNNPELYLNSLLNHQPGSLEYVDVLLGRRGPNVQTFANYWSLPGGFVNIGTENAQECAARELQEETKLVVPVNQFWQIGSHTDPKTDPRAHVFNIIYGVFLPQHSMPMAQDDISEIQWVNCEQWLNGQSGMEYQQLAFNHNDLLSMALKHISRY